MRHAYQATYRIPTNEFDAFLVNDFNRGIKLKCT